MADQVRSILDSLPKDQQNPKGSFQEKPKNKGICCFWEHENNKRGNWSGRLEFFLSCLGFSIGLGSVWRFPFLCYKNGGAAFFIPVVFFLLVIGLPVILVEFTLGQFCSRGILNCWGYVPLFRGLGVGMMLLSAMIAIYHNALTGMSLWYFIQSMANKLPWADCRCKSSSLCATRLLPISLANCTEAHGLTAFTNNGTCYDRNWDLYGIFNATAAMSNRLFRRLPASEFLENEGLMSGVSKGIDDLQYIRWQLAICLLVAWVLVFLFLIMGIRSMGKVAYVTTLLPVLLLLVLLIVAVSQPGAEDGLKLLTANMERLKDLSVWCEAAICVFYLLGVTWGGFITLASFNRFHTDVVRYSLVVPLICLVVYAATAVTFFAFLGIVMKRYAGELGLFILLAHIQSSVAFAFVIVPQGIAELPVPHLWSLLFFLMLVVIGLGTVMVLVLTIVVAFTDAVRKLRSTAGRIVLLLVVCVVLCLLGLTMTTVGGLYMLQLMDDYVIWWSVPVVCLLLLLSFMVYGPLRFSSDVEVMVRKQCCCCMPWALFKWLWILGWLILAPIALLFSVIVCLVKYMPSRLGAYMYPSWANTLGWLMTASILIAVVLATLICAALSRCKCKKLLKPTIFWGPALLKDRKHITYAEGFVVDPKENQKVPEDMQYDHYDQPRDNYVYENAGSDLRTQL